jgi:hypothetical protein
MKKTHQTKGRTSRRKKSGKRKRLFTPTFFFICILLFAITAGISYTYFRPIFAFKSSSDKGVERKVREADKDADMYKSNRLYNAEIWYDTGLKRANTIITIEDVIRDYIRPHGIKLIDLYMDRQGVVYIDLSDEIIKNFTGDARQEYNLIMGLYTSIKKSVGNISAIKLLIGGKEAETIGGHINISRPIGGIFATRKE